MSWLQKECRAVIVLTAILSILGIQAGTARADDRVAETNASITTVLLISSASTQAAMDRAGAEIRTLSNELQRKNAALTTTLAAVRRSDSRRAALQREHDRLLAEMNDLMENVARQDIAYEASLRVYRSGLEGVLASRDPRIEDAMRRYAAGESGAFGEVMEITDIINDAEQAGMIAVQVERLTSNAVVASAGLEDGRTTAAVALDAWSRVRAKDPSRFQPWIEIADLATLTGDDTLKRTALIEALQRAHSDLERADVYLRYHRQSLPSPPGAPDPNPLKAALFVLRRAAAEDPGNGYYQVRVMNTLDLIGRERLAADDYENASLAVDEATEIANRLEAANPDNDFVTRAVWVHAGLVAQRVETARSLDVAAELYDEAVGIARRRSAKNPTSLAVRRDLAVSLADVARVAMKRNDYPRAKSALLEAIGIGQEAIKADPTNVLNGHQAWSQNTELGQFARFHNDPVVAQHALAEALSIGRQFAREDRGGGYMVRLTLPRLYGVEFALGRWESARQRLEELERLYASSGGWRPKQPGDGARFSWAATVISLGNIDMAEGQFDRAGARFQEILDLAAAEPSPESNADRIDLALIRLFAHSKIAELALMRGDPVGYCSELEKISAQTATDIALTPDAADLAMFHLAALAGGADCPQGASSWQDVADHAARLDAMSGLTMEQGVAAAQMGMFAARRLQDGAGTSETLMSGMKASLRTANGLVEEYPGDGRLLYTRASYRMWLRIAGAPGATWTAAAEDYDVLAQGGIILADDDRLQGLETSFGHVRRAGTAGQRRSRRR